MQNYIEVKTNSIHPIYAAGSMMYLLLPVSIMECFNFYLTPGSEYEGEYLNNTIYLN
ncbi:MAG: hypothetical protein ABI151_11130 [Chitinophagaceae bacterium]